MIEKLRALGINVPIGAKGEVKTTCPACSHARKKKGYKCLNVNVDEGVYLCWHCQFSGRVAPDKPEYLKEIKEYVRPQSELKKVSQKVIDWFETRSISNQTLLRYRITESMEYMPQVGEERLCINFNYYDLNGEDLINIKFRDSQKNFKLTKDARLIPYGLDVVNNSSSDAVMFVEGECDCLAFYEAGVPIAVSVPNGATTGAQKLEFIDDYFDFFSTRRKVYIATDQDEPGRALKAELIRRFGRERCYIVSFPEDCKDANDVLIKHGKEILYKCFSEAEPLPLEGITDVDDVFEALVHLQENGLQSGLKLSRLPNLSEHLTWKASQMYICTGVPGHGKSTLVDNIIAELAMEHQQKIGIWSAEKPDVSRHLGGLYQLVSGRSMWYGDKRLTNDDLVQYRSFMKEYFKFINVFKNELHIDALLKKGEELVHRFGIRWLVLDNWAKIEHMIPAGSNKHDYAGKALTKMNLFCERNQCGIILVAHPTKLKRDAAGNVEIPSGYDVSDSSHFFNMTDNGFTVYRNKKTGQTDINVWKVRWEEVGSVGTCHMFFNKAISQFAPQEKLNDGANDNYFKGQPIGEKQVQSFSRLEY